MKCGDTITLLATVTNDEESTSDKEETSQEIGITITIVEATEDDDNENESNSEQTDTNKQTENNSQTQSYMSSSSMENESDLNIATSTIEKSISSSSTTMSSSTSSNDSQMVTYNGSSNNYLSELSIEGYEFTNSFSKENTTYFVKLDSEVESLTVNYTKDDDDSTVCIYGNDDLDNNSNKILISVTAENGDVRTYRVIVIEED